MSDAADDYDIEIAKLIEADRTLMLAPLSFARLRGNSSVQVSMRPRNLLDVKLVDLDRCKRLGDLSASGSPGHPQAVRTPAGSSCGRSVRYRIQVPGSVPRCRRLHDELCPRT